MFGTGSASDTPQFLSKEVAGTNTCKFCGVAIGGPSYRIDGSPACAACTERIRREGPENPHGAFAKAVMFGIVAAVCGLIIYAMFEIMTGLIIGYVSLLVGWMVGKAMMMGSGGFGGRRYQLTAALLTYMAVSIAAIPVYMSLSAKQHSHANAGSAAAQTVSPDASSRARVPADTSGDAGGSKPKPSAGAALGMLALLGMASPFLELAGDPFHGLIGLVILFVGIRIAWKTAEGSHVPSIAGPF